MWPFKPRMVTLPNGRQMTVKALREQERAELKAKELDRELRRKAKELDLARDVDAYDEEKAERAKDKKASKWAKRLGKVGNGFRAVGRRLVNDLPLLAALVVCVVCLVTTIVGQYMFYATLPWPEVDGVLASLIWLLRKVLPFVVEGGSWFYAIVARHLAAQSPPLPHAAATRKMWLFALAAAAMNGYHGAATLKKWEMGVVLGGASLIGPLIWHSYVHLTKAQKSKRNATDILTDLFNRLHHPRLSWRANELWAASKGRISRERAWLEVYRQHYGRFPGEAPRAMVVPSRNGWLFRKVFGTVLVPVPKSAPVVVDERAPKSETSVTEERSSTAPERAPEDLSNDVPLALVGAPESADTSAPESDFEAWERELRERETEALLEGETEAKLERSYPSSEPVSEALVSLPESAREERPQPRGKSASKSARAGRKSKRSRTAKADYTQAIVGWFHERMAEPGASASDIATREVVSHTGCSSQWARKVLRILRANPAATYDDVIAELRK